MSLRLNYRSLILDVSEEQNGEPANHAGSSLIWEFGVSYRTFMDCDDNAVDLTFERWEHIIEGHPIMDGFEKLLGVVLQNPDVRTVNPVNGRSCFYRRNVHPDAPSDFVKVVVEYKPHLDAFIGRIITAFPAERIQAGEHVTWTK